MDLEAGLLLQCSKVDCGKTHLIARAALRFGCFRIFPKYYYQPSSFAEYWTARQVVLRKTSVFASRTHTAGMASRVGRLPTRQTQGQLTIFSRFPCLMYSLFPTRLTGGKLRRKKPPAKGLYHPYPRPPATALIQCRTEIPFGKAPIPAVERMVHRLLPLVRSEHSGRSKCSLPLE